MQLGSSLPQGGGEGSSQAIAQVAREAEAIGLDSPWGLDRLLRPLAPVAAAPGQPARIMPPFYANVFDPIETLTFAAVHTGRVQARLADLVALRQRTP